MNQRILIAKVTLVAASLAFASLAMSASKKNEKVTLSCDFPAAEAPQKMKPGHNNLSDGVIRITAQKLNLTICQGCAWEKTGAKWQVTPTQYRIETNAGVSVTINKKDNSGVFAINTKGDEYYHPGHAESSGQCTPAETSAKK